MEDEKECSPDNLFNMVKRLKESDQVTLLLDIACIDLLELSSNGPRFMLVYRFLNMNTHSRPSIVIKVNEEVIVDSIASLWPNALGHEMEIHDLFGISFNRSYSRIFTKNMISGLPLRKDFISDEMLGHDIQEETRDDNVQYYWFSSWPHGKEAVLFKMVMKGEIVLQSSAVPGFSHKGMEKNLEYLPYHKALPLMEKLNADDNITPPLLWAKTVEELCGITVPDRAKAIRMIFLEIARIYSHFVSISQMMIHFGLTSFNLLLDQFQKDIINIFYEYKRRGDFSGIAQIGGVQNVDLHWTRLCVQLLNRLKKHVRSIENICSCDNDWMAKLQFFSIDSLFAIHWGYTGPYLRGLGFNYDLRKASPYYFYGDLDFDIPLGIHQTGYDCYLVKVEEIHQSIKIISQLLNNLPSGNSMNKSYSFRFEDARSKEDFYKHVITGIVSPVGSTYSFLEGPYGEMGLYLVSEETNKAYRVKIRSPHYPMLFSFDRLFQGKTLQEVDDMLISFSLSTSEIDR